MLDIDEMAETEIIELLQQVGYGHLSCSLEGQVYVMSMHYYFEGPDIYIFTTEGMKTGYIDANPQVCLQVEEIDTPSHWRSVVVNGRAERLTERQDIECAMQLVKEHNPTLSPAINKTWIDAWGRKNERVIYRIRCSEMSGRAIDEPSSRQK